MSGPSKEAFAKLHTENKKLLKQETQGYHLQNLENNLLKDLIDRAKEHELEYLDYLVKLQEQREKNCQLLTQTFEICLRYQKLCRQLRIEPKMKLTELRDEMKEFVVKTNVKHMEKCKEQQDELLHEWLDHVNSLITKFLASPTPEVPKNERKLDESS
ncbi:unnamed protein product [Bursaphelenchus okinawaensis]|uniref:Uncharacterized protein n=1 Tax=Bursaphelenchus okinawaensis TaxID=465554 RepID=A0A811JVJ0_9BILA|nr:unnamed protein product [Bursaphelenchus okinawaensis]CAG9084948.1 unnamed protein product [Bursaphelenchus okinawaensis]